jgi:microcystin-dependent protein
MDGFIGEIKYFTGTYAPKGWMFCEGQTLQINQFTPLYSLIGTQFGGDGRTNFNLPDFRGRMTIGTGQSTGTSYRHQGETGGTETVQITQLSMPTHIHSVKCDVASPPPMQKNTPENNLPGLKSNGTAYAPGASATSQMNQNMVAAEGQSQAHENMPPWTCLHYIICVYGYYPIRP